MLNIFMGKIVLDRLPKRENAEKTYTYADLHMDLVDNYNINDYLFQKSEITDFKLDYDIEAIKNSLYNIFTTTPGEKILNPEFGMDIRRYIFEPATIDTAKEIRRKIFQQIRSYEPRITLKSVDITVLEDVNEFDIIIYFDIPALNINNIPLFGNLNSGGYVFRN
jgi:phage baseplate assembly protein W